MLRLTRCIFLVACILNFSRLFATMSQQFIWMELRKKGSRLQWQWQKLLRNRVLGIKTSTKEAPGDGARDILKSGRYHPRVLILESDGIGRRRFSICSPYWADSAYGYLEERRIVELAEELEFPLARFTCKHGAGLSTKGDKTGYFIEIFEERSAAQVVIIEMGYNDDKKLSTGDFAKGMQKQSWFTFLKDQSSTVKHVIFILRPT